MSSAPNTYTSEHLPLGVLGLFDVRPVLLRVRSRAVQGVRVWSEPMISHAILDSIMADDFVAEQDILLFGAGTDIVDNQPSAVRWFIGNNSDVQH
jgi:hypothetical protein